MTFSFLVQLNVRLYTILKAITIYDSSRKEIRIIFPSDSFEVLVEEANTHEHAEDPDYSGGQSTVYRWSKEASDIIVIGVKNALRPKVLLRNMRDRNFPANYREPVTDRQLGQYSPVTSKTPSFQSQTFYMLNTD